MTVKGKTLPFDGCVELVSQVVDDFVTFSKGAASDIPRKKIYKVASSKEPAGIVRSARVAALRDVTNNLFFEKFAMDKRRIDEMERNPRKNLQTWNRSQQFIDAQKHKRMTTFARLMDPLNNIKKVYGTQPEYFDSYARKLHDLVTRALRVKEADQEIYTPQLNYLEQLLDARYRLSMEDVLGMDKEVLEKRILSKDEDLLRRGSYLEATDYEDDTPKIVVKDEDKGITQKSIINAIFGNNEFRRDGEKKVQRTITITICDEAIE